MKRLSCVGQVYIPSIVASSVFQVGDNAIIDTQADVFAVQRARPRFRGGEGAWSQFTTFAQDLPVPEIREQVEVHTRERSGLITVGWVRIVGISSSGVLQIGSNRVLRAMSRTKNIRQFWPSERQKVESAENES